MGDKKKEKKISKSKSESEINSLKKERDDFKNIAARAQADLVNYRNRMKMELSEIESRGKKTVSLKVLSVIDELELAIDSVTKNASLDLMLEGLKSIREKFRTIFESENIQEITEIEDFDPVFHEAVLTTETDEYEPGSIIKILRKGYIMNSDVIRPAQVEIASQKNEVKENK